MDKSFPVIEYEQLCQSERSARDRLFGIYNFSAIVLAGLFLARYQFQMEFAVLIAPFILYVCGFMYSSEALRLLRITDRLSSVEQQMAGMSEEPGSFFKAELSSRMRFFSITAIAGFFYGVFWLASLALLWVSQYPEVLRVALLASSVVLGGIVWGIDLWLNRKFIPK